jgi:GAF domain-containing protein
VGKFNLPRPGPDGYLCGEAVRGHGVEGQTADEPPRGPTGGRGHTRGGWGMHCEDSLADALAQVADALIGEFEVGEFAARLAELCMARLQVDAVVLVLGDAGGGFEVSAGTSDHGRLLARWQVEWQEGPVVDCGRSGRALVVTDARAGWVRRQWPRFGMGCRRVGFYGVLTVPMHRGEQVLGVLSFLQRTTGGFDPARVRVAQALADVGTVGLLHRRVQREQTMLIEQLRGALTSRVVIEQAKGVLAERHNVDTDQAFAALRQSAREGNYRLTEMARAVVNGSGSADASHIP